MAPAIIANLQKGYTALREHAETPVTSSLQALNASNSMLQQELGSFKAQLLSETEKLPSGEPVLKAEYELLLQLARLNQAQEQRVLKGVEKVERGRVAAFKANACGLQDISPLAGIRGLRKLDLTQNMISDLTPLSGLTALKVLRLSSNLITDIKSLAGLTGLEQLELEGNSIADIAPLSGMTCLQQLLLWENKIVSLDPLAGLVNLQDLDIAHNEIRDIACLSGLKKLRWLHVMKNPFSCDSRRILEELSSRGVRCLK